MVCPDQVDFNHFAEGPEVDLVVLTQIGLLIHVLAVFARLLRHLDLNWGLVAGVVRVETVADKFWDVWLYRHEFVATGIVRVALYSRDLLKAGFVSCCSNALLPFNFVLETILHNRVNYLLVALSKSQPGAIYTQEFPPTRLVLYRNFAPASFGNSFAHWLVGVTELGVAFWIVK